MKENRTRHCAALVVAGAGIAAAGSAHALRFQLADGAIDGSFDTTLTYGLSLRTESPEADLTNPSGIPGQAFANQYGNRALFTDKWDIVTHTVKASHDLELSGESWGAFMRGNYFYDFELANQPLPDAAENRLVSHGDITDAYLLYRFGGNDQFMIRAGKQVISWGENTFIGGSLNDINTVDITKLRQPGVELKDALVGTPAVYFSWGLSEALSLETFVLLGYDEAKPDPMGSFFATTDFAFDGGGLPNAVDGLGRPVCLAPDGFFTGPATALNTCHLQIGPQPVTRIGDDIPSPGGQFGLALRYYLDALTGFDLGLYYQRLHDHNPQVSGTAATPIGPGLPMPGKYYLDYAEDVERYGLSFNTTLGPWAIGGEYSYRRNAPLQGANFATVAAFGCTVSPGMGPTGCADAGGATVTPGAKFEGFERYKRHQIQVTMQRLWGPMPMLFGADQWNTIGEVAYGWIEDAPGLDNDGHRLPPGPPPPTPADSSGFIRFDDITNNFWGFQGRSTLTYNNALLNRVNMDVNMAYRWDVDGVSPEFGGAQLFIQDRMQGSLGVAFDYALRWRLTIDHTWVWGGEGQYRPNGSRNITNTDRDFFSVSLSYTF
jgi:hypothetical protein